MPYRNGNIVWNVTVWTPQMIRYLRRHFHEKTNSRLASELKVGLTVLRNKTRELGLKKYQIEYWNDAMILFLRKSYKTMGDVEIMDFFKKCYPKKKGWKRGAINKKRNQLGLKRTPAQVESIVKRHHKKGGRRYTIDRNSSSIHMKPMWVAQQIAWRNPELQRELLKHPEIIETARSLIKLKRIIKEKMRA